MGKIYKKDDCRSGGNFFNYYNREADSSRRQDREHFEPASDLRSDGENSLKIHLDPWNGWIEKKNLLGKKEKFFSAALSIDIDSNLKIKKLKISYKSPRGQIPVKHAVFCDSCFSTYHVTFDVPESDLPNRNLKVLVECSLLLKGFSLFGKTKEFIARASLHLGKNH